MDDYMLGIDSLIGDAGTGGAPSVDLPEFGPELPPGFVMPKPTTSTPKAAPAAKKTPVPAPVSKPVAAAPVPGAPSWFSRPVLGPLKGWQVILTGVGGLALVSAISMLAAGPRRA